MLSFHDRDARGSRRTFLRVGGAAALGLGGAAWGRVPQGRAAALAALVDAAPPGLLTGKSVIFVFLHGGPSQFETFDPKPDQPEGIRSATGAIGTSLPGVQFGASFPRLAALADRLTIVRSFVPGDPDHNLKPLVGRDTFNANLGAVYARVAGANDARTGLPTNVLLQPRAVDPGAQEGTTAFGRFNATGSLSASDGPFEPGRGLPGSEAGTSGLSLAYPRERLDDRLGLLRRLDVLSRDLDRTRPVEGVDRLRDQAVRLLTGGLAEAFDLGREDPRLVDRYDTAPLMRPDAIDKQWKNYNNYVDNARTLGKLLLMARRLCERGAGFVTVTTNFVWDMHADENNAPMVEGMRYMGGPLDHALSALVEDLHARGLHEKVLVVACGEMGRSPRINGKGGRDHWGGLGPMLLYGGGLPGGRVIGQSNRDGSGPLTEPITGRHLSASLLHTLFDVAELRLVPNLPTEFGQLMPSWPPIPGLSG